MALSSHAISPATNPSSAFFYILTVLVLSYGTQQLHLSNATLLNGVMLGLTPAEARARYEQVIDFAELREFEDLKLKNYSSGMHVRLAFSVAIQVDAEILLIDEVLAVGDAAFQQKCFDVFNEMRDAGRTILFVTHDMGAVARFCDRAMLLDYRSYLRDNLLVKVDRATMLSSVEARAPFLDKYVTAFALSLPTDLRVHGLTTKWVLKKAAEKWIPRDVIYRRKRGLSVPTASWINRGLRSEVDRLLDPKRLREQGIVNEAAASRLLAEHRGGHANHARSIWALVMLQYWMDRWGGRGK